MKKCIIFARVSTNAQSLDEQSRELQEIAQKDGYAQSQQVIIEMKESAIKLKEEERLGLNKMKEYIENDPSIDCLYIWEISRWARKKYILFSLQNYLVERKIQLKVKTPEIVLLNNDGTLNSSADWMFTIYAQLSETEMNLKLERFKRARKERKREGFKSFSKLPYGYTTDENNKIIIDKEQAKIVKKIFEMSLDYTRYQIYHELETLGVKLTINKIAYIQRHKAYIGKFIDVNGDVIAYPRMLSDEQFNKVQEHLDKNKKQGKTKKYHLCGGLIVCPECGSFLTAGTTSYKCVRNSRERHLSNGPSCNSKTNVTFKYIDKIVMEEAKACLYQDLKESSKSEKKRIRHDISENEKKLKVVLAKIDGIRKRKEKVALTFEMGTISIEYFKERIKAIEAEAVQLFNDKDYLENAIQSLYNDLNGFSTQKYTRQQLRELFIDTDKKEFNDEDSYKLVHKYVTKIRMRVIGKIKIFEIQTTKNTNNRYMFSGRGNAMTIKTNTELEMLQKSFDELTREDFNELVTNIL